MSVSGMAPNAKPRTFVYAMVVAIMAVGPLNFLLFRVMYDSFGSSSAFFVSQGVNFLYMVIGGVILYPKLWHLDGSPNYTLVSREMRNLPQRRFVAMAALDCAGTFLAAMGAVHTPGQYQTLLNQSLIPFTMAASSVFLRAAYNSSQYVGACTILLGALVAISPTFLGTASNNSSNNDSSASNASDDGGEGPPASEWISNCLYLASNLPMALSAVYKERRFAADDVHPLYLTQWVSIYQFLFGFVLMPLQLLPHVGSDSGMSLVEIGESFNQGWQCWLEAPGACPPGSSHTFWLLPGYCLVNFVFNMLGLFLTSEGGASLNAISYSMLLPLTTLSNSLPLLGKFRENLQLPTLVGLVLVLLGFFAYEIDELWPKDSGIFTNFAPLATSPELVSIADEKPATATAINSSRKLTALDDDGRVDGGVDASEDGTHRDARITSSSSSSSDSSSSVDNNNTNGGSVRKSKTASFQERMVLVPLPTAGSAHKRPSLDPSRALAEQQAKWSEQKRREGYAAVDTSASAPPV